MLKSKDLSLQIAGSVALAMLVGTSAFAESRHLGGTRGGGFSHSSPGRMGGGAPRFDSRGFSGRSFGSRGSAAPRFESRGFSGRSFGSRGSAAPRFESRSFSGRSFGSRGSAAPRFGSRGSSPAPRFGSRGSAAPRFGSRGSSNYGRNVPFHGYNSGSRFYGRGRIDRVVPYHGGYRVWLGGWGYPFFVPYRFYDPFRFRIGLFVGFNAFYDPLGYYSVYGWPGYYPGYYPYAYPPAAYVGTYRDGNYDGYNDSVVRGVVESIDLHTGLVVLNDEASRRSVTAILPPRDRRVDEIRVGDYIELSGGWTHSGQFDADTLDRFEPRR